METPGEIDCRQILVVEDEPLIAMLVEAMLVDLGFKVLGPAHTVASALDLLGEEPRIDAALIDLNLGGQSAFPVADALRARGVPMIFCTGYGEMGLREVDLGSPVLCKPYRPADISAALHALFVAV